MLCHVGTFVPLNHQNQCVSCMWCSSKETAPTFQGWCFAKAVSLLVRHFKRSWKTLMMISRPFWKWTKFHVHKRYSPHGWCLDWKPTWIHVVLIVCFLASKNIIDHNASSCSFEVLKKDGQLLMTGKAYNNRCIAQWLYDVVGRAHLISADPRMPLALLCMMLTCTCCA